jgi:hypothetical protein
MSQWEYDSYYFNKEELYIAAGSNLAHFDPREYGMGFKRNEIIDWCEFIITNDGLFLKHLNMKLLPPFYYYLSCDVKHYQCRNLNIPISFTGRIVGGMGFTDWHYINMGYPRAWACEKLIEFIFEDGKLIRTIDFSESAAELRESEKMRKYLESKRKSSKNIEVFVEDSFSLDF